MHTHVHVTDTHPHARACVCVRVQQGMLRSALDSYVDPASCMDARLVVRCAGAMLRQHADLAPGACTAALEELLACVRSKDCMGWQRIAALQALRHVAAEPGLVRRDSVGGTTACRE